MTSAPTFNTPPVRVLTGQERAAAIIMAMGPDAAQKVIKHLGQDQIRMLTKIGSTLGRVTRAQLNDVVDEFVDNFTHSPDIIGNPGEIQKLLRNILPKEQLDDIMDELHGNANRTIWERISKVQDSTIAVYLNKEHPQTAAVILSKINESTAARVIEQLTPDMRKTVTNRMLSLKPIVDQTLKKLEAALQENFVTNFTRDANADTHARMAKIINKMDRENMEQILSEIGITKPKSVEALKSMLFTFEDIVKLTSNDRNTLMDGFSPDTLSVALNGAKEHVREAILSGIPSRTRKMIENLIETNDTPTPKEISDARRLITDTALDLAGKNRITVPSGNDEL